KDIELKVREMAVQIQEPFYLLVAGEYNAGKSSFINALLGVKILKEGPTPTTRKITILTHGDGYNVEEIQENLCRVTYPIEILKDITLIDTPGTNSVFVEHEKIIASFIHRAELVIFITSADKPLTESECQFLELLKGKWGRKVLFILNKIDLKTEEEQKEIISFIEKNCYKLLGFEPKILTVSSTDAFKAKDTKSQELLKKSNVEEVEDFINEKLDLEVKMELKYLSPLKFLSNVFGELRQELQGQITRYNSEIAGIERLEARLKSKKEDMQDYCQKYKGEIQSAFSRLKERLDTFLGFHMTTRALVTSMFSREKIADRFRKEMTSLANPLEDLDRVIDDAAEYVSRNNRSLWEMALDYKNEEKGEKKPGEGRAGLSFEDKKNELRYLLREHSKEYREFDINKESERLRVVAQSGLAGFLALEGVALAALGGFGYLLTFLAPAAAIMVLAFALIGVGFIIVPNKRKAFRNELFKRVDVLCERFTGFMANELEKSVDRVIEDIENNVSSFRDVRWSEREGAMKHLAELNELADRIRALVGKSTIP
ncbi:MAG TPA: dynamin family protein, partial [Candidatus Hypogeohydataceae bacterium YC40]